MACANFFWAFAPISLYDELCIESFVKNEFEVNLYTYDENIRIDGVNTLNANEIIKKNEVNKYNFSGYKSSPYSGLSNEFRYLLMSKNKGWWFDTDVFCLKNAKFFDNLDKENQKFIAGFEKSKDVNVAVLKINEKKIIHDLLDELKIKKKKLKWGELGPTLFTKILQKHNLINLSQPKNLFYSINYENFMFPLLSTKKLETENLLKESYVCHLYNEIQRRHGIPKNILPPKNSFLYAKFKEIRPKIIEIEDFCLPDVTMEILLKIKNTSSIKENFVHLAKGIKEKFN
ncbi:hypothetical protein IDG51_03205 [Pelagibacterales bacterium SAG-MED14]|nr:hypothetical protein [Pelagibacterales bacterium SAG-MED14]